MDEKRILIEGIGGIGGVIAARLLQAGYKPTLITGNAQITDVINRDGLRLNTPEGQIAISTQALTALDELPADQPFDAAYLIMKANTVVNAARLTIPYLKPDAYVVTFQNGVVEDAVAAEIGASRVIGAIIGWGGTMTAPGLYRKTSPGHTHIGELNGEVSERLRHLAQLLGYAAPVTITQNIRGALWSKLALNCSTTSLSAITGETLGDMVRDGRKRRLCLGIFREVVDTASALGITLERIAANPKLLYLPANANLFNRFARDLLVRFIGYRYGAVKPSMLQSLERGRKTEIDFLNGYVTEQASQVNIATPVNTALTRFVKEIEVGSRSIAPANFETLLADLK